MSINKVFISGNLCDDCSKHGSSDSPVVMFTVAVNDRVKNGDEWEDRPNFIDCKMFGNYAKAVSASLKKGVRVAVDGALREEKWQDNEGNNRRKLSIIVTNIEIMVAKADGKPNKSGKKSNSDGEAW